jgi:hypothetical protein
MGQAMTEQRPFQVGDEVRWRWHEDDENGKWFKAKLVEQHPADYPSGWAGEVTDQGTFYADNGDGWDAPIGFVVYMDEPSMVLTPPVEAQA